MEFKELILIAIAAIAGFINTVAGGGSILILPTLILFIGLPPGMANGTNRIGILIQTIFSAWGFKSKGISPFVFGEKKSLLCGFVTLLGAVVGSKIAIGISDLLFNRILSVVMLIVLFFTFYKPKSFNNTSKNTKKGYLLMLIFFFFIGIYAGFIQAGTGLLLIALLAYFANLSLVKANAIKTIIVFIFTLGTISVFAYHNQINLKYGLLLGIGNALGGWIASRWSVQKGDKAIKIVMVISVILMAIKLWVV